MDNKPDDEWPFPRDEVADALEATAPADGRCSVCGQPVASGELYDHLTARHAATGDPRFTVGLALNVARVIEDHGYEPLNGGQMVELQQHLFHLLHGDPEGSCTGGAR